MKKFIRGTISNRLFEECKNLKKEIIDKKIITNEKFLTLPKLQNVILEKKNRKMDRLPADVIRRIILG